MVFSEKPAPEALIAPAYSKANPYEPRGPFTEAQIAQRWIYIVQGDDGGPVKIGQTHQEPSRRVAALQCGYPFGKLRLIGAWLAPDREIERVIHERFKHLRLHGEWFKLDADLVTFILRVRTAEKLETISDLLPREADE